jgi:chromosome segregation protein
MHREWCASLPDEIGAPMKARLQRLYDFLFNRLVKETVSHSQILMITHNKKTMEIADSLYGVTMQKQGISTLVSVSLN